MRQIVIVGGGIVGAALAAELAARRLGKVVVLDQGPRQGLAGSTGHAPGYVGIYNDSNVLAELARRSVDTYRTISFAGQAGFSPAGSLELAEDAAELELVHARAARARAIGLAATAVSAAEAAALAPHLVPESRCAGGVHYGGDGTARAEVITAGLRERAERDGVVFRYQTSVREIEVSGSRVKRVHTPADTLAVDDVVIATGIWGPRVAASTGYTLPLTPVAHPYVYGPKHARAEDTTPFVRWPTKHVYTRDHGDQIGIGTYDHAPQPVAQEELGTRADRAWPEKLFDEAIARALGLLPESYRFEPVTRLNGIFSMTADNLPLIGPTTLVQGLWIAAAVWVTHAAGAASLLASWMAGEDFRGGHAVHDPDRFKGESAQSLQKRALRLYRDIYSGVEV
jgi:glycine/D-amino acid oxidase-like deaminating enzyme